MSCSLPPEILDIIVDHLQNEPITLRACCLVSNSWVSRTRRHLFARIKFDSVGSVKSWLEAFPDPSNSPAHYTRALQLFDYQAVKDAISDTCFWIQSFNCIAKLHVKFFSMDDGGFSLTQLYGLSPTLKSLTLFYPGLPHSQTLHFICSFPLLEDISVYSYSYPNDDAYAWDVPPTSPKLTGFLNLNSNVNHIARGLLSLPGGLRFSKIAVSCPIGDSGSREELVSMCSGTLEYLVIEHYPLSSRPGTLRPLDLSKAIKLKYVHFLWHEPNVQWISTALRTAKSENLQRIAIQFLPTLPGLPEGTDRREWEDLDNLLVQLWTTRSIHPVFEFESGIRELGPMLLPELASRGAVAT